MVAGSAPMIGPVPLNPQYTVPISVLLDSGRVVVVRIPRMSSEAFEFFKRQLELFSECITYETDEPVLSVKDTMAMEAD